MERMWWKGCGRVSTSGNGARALKTAAGKPIVLHFSVSRVIFLCVFVCFFSVCTHSFCCAPLRALVQCLHAYIANPRWYEGGIFPREMKPYPGRTESCVRPSGAPRKAFFCRNVLSTVPPFSRPAAFVWPLASRARNQSSSPTRRWPVQIESPAIFLGIIK